MNSGFVLPEAGKRFEDSNAVYVNHTIWFMGYFLDKQHNSDINFFIIIIEIRADFL